MMKTYKAKAIHQQLLETIWEGIYLDKTLSVNEVIEDLVSYLSDKEAERMLHIYKRGDP